MNERASDAKVQGEPFTNWPKDLYIPPDALKVLLDTFEGPLDLLLYLIRQHNLDILNIPIAEITRQYLEYIQLMKELRFELAAEYLVMAATLAEIKSRMLLPVPPELEGADEADVRADLMRKLQVYEQIKKVAHELNQQPQQGIDVFWAIAECHAADLVKVEPQVDLTALLSAFKAVLKRADLHQHHVISREILSVRERMSHILGMVKDKKHLVFSEFFKFAEGRMGLVVTFVAILELVKQSLIEIAQGELLGELLVREKFSV
jgi:segregation and condensation protein A